MGKFGPKFYCCFLKRLEIFAKELFHIPFVIYTEKFFVKNKYEVFKGVKVVNNA